MKDDSIAMGMSGGPFMEGTWYNPNTGDSFTVKDTYFEGDQLYIMTMDGRRYNGDMISGYVQSDGPITKKPEIDPNQQLDKGTLLQGMDADMQAEVVGLINGSQSTPTNPLDQVITQTPSSDVQQTTRVSTQEDEDDLLIRRMIDRVDPPKIIATCKWSKLPTKQLEMLDMMGVNPAKISKYILNKYDVNELRHLIGEAILKSIAIEEEKEEKKSKK